eukprot:m.146879 g.146879  ORF g.146879 m.146879 type:complete len:364 (-) comp30505_c0_seq1:372-1463(-)
MEVQKPKRDLERDSSRPSGVEKKTKLKLEEDTSRIRNVTTKKGDKVMLGEKEYVFAVEGSKLQELSDSNHLLDDPVALAAELKEKGYLLIRQLHDRDEVLDARLAVLKHIGQLGEKLDPAHNWEEGVLLQRCGQGCVPFMEGRNDISHSAAVSKVLEGERPKGFFSKLFGGECATFDYKWLRAMYNSGFTGAHTDSVYMSRGTQNLITMWTPIGDVDTQMETIAVIEHSNRSTEFAKLRETYSSMDAEAVGLDGTGWFTSDPDEIIERFGGVWKTTDFKAGDVLMFTMHTTHMSTTNVTNFARVSCDTRWQRKSEPMDPRYVGEAASATKVKFGTNSSDEKDKKPAKVSMVTMAQKKKEWGFE